MTRSTVLEALHDDYVRTARSKGLRESAVVSAARAAQRAAAGGHHVGRGHRAR